MVGKLKILVADDEENARVMLKQMALIMGHDAILARNGMEAVELFESESPDIVLMDVMMPVLDGYAATARIRELHNEKWVPIVYLSALDRTVNLLKGLDAGGDDYIAKPVHLPELQAKICAIQRVAELQKALAEKRKLLETYFQKAEEEARIGSHLMERLTSTAGLSDQAVNYWTRPLQHFSGDLVAAARTPANVLYVMLADAVGHGLPAALNVLPLADTFYSMAQTGFPLSRIIEEMDRKIKQLLPIDRFVTATFVAVDEYAQEIQIWNGGNPAPIYFNGSDRLIRFDKARRLPLGLLRNYETDTHPETTAYMENGQILLFTDGLCEAASAEGEYFECERILRDLHHTARDQRLDFLLAEFIRHLGGQHLQDDVSIMLVDVSCGAAHLSPKARRAGEAELPLRGSSRMALGWKAEFRLSARELKALDTVPFLAKVVEELEISSEHRRQIFMILSELFNNALEHGLLGLDSRIKTTFEGFEMYLSQRSHRLQELESGRIDITLERMMLNHKLAIKIYMRDSGAGFDHEALTGEVESHIHRLHGRGILLVKTLSHSLQYLGAGNEVVAYYLV